MMSWEYPPVVVGGLGRHVHALATELAAAGHDVVVLSRQPAGTDAATHPTTDDVLDGRAGAARGRGPGAPGVRAGPGRLDARDGPRAAARRAHALCDGWRPDVVHAHDWLVAHPAIALADVLGVPLVATIHATEAGRHTGWLSSPLNQQVHSVEWWLARRADTVITCSAAMRDEVARAVRPRPRADRRAAQRHRAAALAGRARQVQAARDRYAPRGEPLLLYFGRLEYEKGVQDLIAALPRIRRAHPGTRLLVAGTGTRPTCSWRRPAPTACGAA